MTQNFQDATKAFETILDFLRFAVSAAHAEKLYYGHGTDNAMDDMRSLILATLSLPYDLDASWLSARLSGDEKSRLCRQLERRILERIPVPYLINEAYFCDLLFYVDERVLIPRSPIAELIEQQFAPWVEPDAVMRVLDLCTGSACIAIACCYAFPDAMVDAVDLSPDALAVATLNVDSHDLADRLTLIESDCFANVPMQRYDLIVSNPPYVSMAEMQTLPDEYLHEPRMALEAAKNGLAIVEEILLKAADYLTPAGVLVVEVGNSEEALMERYPHVPFTWIEFLHGGHGVFILTYEQLIALRGFA